MSKIIAILGLMTGATLLVASVVGMVSTINIIMDNPLASTMGGLFFLVSLTMGGIAWTLIIVAYQHWWWRGPRGFSTTTTDPDDYTPREKEKGVRWT